MRISPAQRRVRRGFTLVEMLVVITIIGILAGLAIPAVIVARNRAKVGAMVMDIKQLEMACQAYKEKFGEYPPDFAFVPGANYYTGGADNPAQTASQQIVLRHLARAFPRYAPGVTGGGTGWPGLAHDLDAVGVDVSRLSPRTALAFWLGGIPDPNNNYVPSGFGADPTNPISLPPQTVAYYPSPPICASRITPFFDFDSTRLKKIQGPNSSRQPGYTCLYWPQGMVVDTTTFAENVTGAITYFRAENNMYTVTYATGAVTVSAAKTQQDMADSSNGATGVWVYPAFDTRTSATATIPHVINWINPSSVQIFSSGLDSRFGNILPPTMANGLTDSGLQFPTGENYVQPYTFDDISNFSGGKLEDAIP